MGPMQERRLFHTTGASVSAIFEEGFDTRLSAAGNFGRGIYFSDSPKKCDRYWRGGAGDRVMFVAQVVLGDAKVYPRGQNDRRLTREPERRAADSTAHDDQRRASQSPAPATPRFGGASGGGAAAGQVHSTDRFDSVQGHINTADEFVIYQNARAYPMFAVTYTPHSPHQGHPHAHAHAHAHASGAPPGHPGRHLHAGGGSAPLPMGVSRPSTPVFGQSAAAMRAEQQAAAAVRAEQEAEE